MYYLCSRMICICSTHPPPDLTIMRCIKTPNKGGETLFASSVKAAELLPVQKLEKMGIHPENVRVNYKLFHDYEIARAGTHLLKAEGAKGKTDEGGWDVNLAEGTSVPLVIRERHSGGTKSMVGTYHVASISHLDDDIADPPRLGFEEANRYLAEAWMPGLSEEQYVYKHQWQVGDLVMWSNRLVIHTATSTKAYEGQERLHTRIRMRAKEEDAPVAWKVSNIE